MAAAPFLFFDRPDAAHAQFLRPDAAHSKNLSIHREAHLAAGKNKAVYSAGVMLIRWARVVFQHGAQRRAFVLRHPFKPLARKVHLQMAPGASDP